MADNISSHSIYLLPGMKIKIKVPISKTQNTGFFVRQGDTPPEGYFINNQNVGQMIRGFVCEDETIGTIAASPEAEAAVIYTHKKAEKNAIWFFAATGEIGIMNVISVPIHDHSSIVQGGPAFGTYFSDDEGV